MEKDDNKLGDFFRKRLGENEQPEAWDRPDDAIREQVLGKIMGAPRAVPTNVTILSHSLWTRIAPIAIGAAMILLVLGLGLYNWLLSEQVQQLQAERQQQEKVVLITQSDKLQLEQQIKQLDKKTGEMSQVITSVEQQLTQQRRHFEELLQSRMQQINQLQQQRTALVDSLSQLHTQIATITSTLTTTNEAITTRTTIPQPTKNDRLQKIYKKYPGDLSYTTPAPQLTLASLEEQAVLSTAPRKRFEVGYELSTLPLELPIERSFKEQRLASQRIQNQVTNAMAHGINVGYSPWRNWWIKAGVRRSSVALQQRFNIGLAYNKTNEEMRPGEPTTNELLLKTRAGDADIESAFTVRFEPGDELEEGELVEVGIEDFLTLDVYQLPIGLEYYAGSGRLQFLLQGGVQWSSLRYREYNFTTEIRARGARLDADQGKVLSKDIPSSNSFGLYGGLGVNYELFPNWHLRTSFNYNINFINTNNRKDASPSENGTAFRAGINYRF
ncbi:MAG: hypothetical protein AAF798_16400 [Bacteroidota bacterium]